MIPKPKKATRIEVSQLSVKVSTRAAPDREAEIKEDGEKARLQLVQVIRIKYDDRNDGQAICVGLAVE
jgi:hypothetical protein